MSACSASWDMTSKIERAWLLSRKPAGDSSFRAVFFTENSGIVHCYCKGWRKNRKQAILQPFTPVYLGYVERQGWYYGRSLELSGPVLNLNSNALFSAHYLNEIIYYSLKPSQLEPLLFQHFEQSLNALQHVETNQQIEQILRRFERHLLRVSGYDYAFDKDINNQPVIAEQHYQFIAGDGFSVGQEGLPGELLLAISEENDDHLQAMKALKKIMRIAIDHMLDGREIKSRKLRIC